MLRHGFALLVLALVSGCVPALVPGPQHHELFVFIGEPLDLKKLAPDATVSMDEAFTARYRVLEEIYGHGPGAEIEFTAYDHYGVPPFAKHDVVMLYLVRIDGQWFHEKYLFHALHRTADGRWANCGSPAAVGGPRSAAAWLLPRPLQFSPPWAIPIGDGPPESFYRRFPPDWFEQRGSVMFCRAGNYPQELFRFNAEGVLKARGVFR